jgi:hypothetical protein
MTDLPPTWGIPVRKDGSPVNDVCVITRNYTWFMVWCELNKVNPRHHMVHWVRGAHDLLGREGFDVAIYGEYPPGKYVELSQELERLKKLGLLGQEYHHNQPDRLRPFVI